MVSIPIVPPAVPVRSFAFPEPAELPLADAEPAPSPATAAAVAGPPLRAPHCTRIKPPGDIIKLADRLHYVLQPSLESLLAEGSLAFPFRPFPFQFEGVAFLYPRQAAILADEMGLGKTMQAITAIRLLLRRGEVRSVLLVCPKPLVTNWQREFAVWAPEVPLMVDRRRPGQARAGNGRCPTCRCGSPTTNCCCAIAELLGRAGAFRPGGARRIAADQEPRQLHQRGRLLDLPQAQLGPDRHAGREQRRRPAGHLRVPRPGLPLAGDEAAQHGPDHPRLRPAAHQGPGAHATCRRS